LSRGQGTPHTPGITVEIGAQNLFGRSSDDSIATSLFQQPIQALGGMDDLKVVIEADQCPSQGLEDLAHGGHEHCGILRW
jgi:hypothetical protein